MFSAKKSNIFEKKKLKKNRKNFENYLLFVETESVVSSESLVTDVALVWLYTRVQFDVLFQVVISKNSFKIIKNTYNVIIT